MGSGIATGFYTPLIADGTKIRVKYYIDPAVVLPSTTGGLIIEVYEYSGGSWVLRGTKSTAHTSITTGTTTDFRPTFGVTGAQASQGTAGIRSYALYEVTHPATAGSPSSDPEITTVSGMLQVNSQSGTVYTGLVEGDVDGT